MLKNPMHRQVLILACAQALFQIVSVMVMTVGGLAGGQIAASPRWATLPIATMFLGTATMMFPASMWMARAGRRAGFLIGTTLGVAGAWWVPGASIRLRCRCCPSAPSWWAATRRSRSSTVSRPAKWRTRLSAHARSRW
ncbi:hypothetical protein [Ottowia beijingensis]|uniref:hypothetical protein n=1 Tax=Ottowia beijingensis TaxID=1207057 RepID=UPI00214D8372|nr:hypothetical protein [Ottowia beijingensis]